MSALHSIEAHYTLTFVVFIVLLVIAIALGIRRFVTPMLVDAGTQITLAQVGEIGSRIKLELAQSRSITRTIPLLDSDSIDRVLLGWSTSTAMPRCSAAGSGPAGQAHAGRAPSTTAMPREGWRSTSTGTPPSR